MESIVGGGYGTLRMHPPCRERISSTERCNFYTFAHGRKTVTYNPNPSRNLDNLYRRSAIRQRCDPAQIDHFLSWLIETNLLVSVAWGNTHLKLENGTTLTIPRQILQAKRTHAVHQYQSHCAEVRFHSLSNRKLLYLLESINTRSQK